MARPLRLHVPGGFYHVTLRGNHRLPIFFTEQDRSLLDEIVAHVTIKYSARIHAYCWMTNHLHMAIQVCDPPLGRVIHQIASRYARTVQARLDTSGHLFERRYHGILVDTDRYLLALVRYIHLNPVDAGLVTDPAHYRWSSHMDYLGIASRPWVQTGFVLRMLGATRPSAEVGYLALMGKSLPSHLEELPKPGKGSQTRVLGDESFQARINSDPHTPRQDPNRLEDLVSECALRFGYSVELLASCSRQRGLAAARAWLGHEVVSTGATTICGIARRLNRSESTIRQLMLRYPRPRSGE
jgi:REP element-mobilizing transposase RayT